MSGFRKRTRSVIAVVLMAVLILVSSAGTDVLRRAAVGGDGSLSRYLHLEVYAASRAVATLGKYEQVKKGMTRKEVEKIFGGQGRAQGETDSNRLLWKASPADENAVKEVMVSFNQNAEVRDKRIFYAFKYEDGRGGASIVGYTGKAKKITVPRKIDGIAVKSIWLVNEGLEALDVSRCRELRSLDCGKNRLQRLDVRKCKNLTNLNCFRNQLGELKVSSCVKLTRLYCDENKLATLDVSKCIKLTELHCEGNKLTTLDVGKCRNLKYLYCGYNSLSKLRTGGCEKLFDLKCSNNKLTLLSLKKNRNLGILVCHGNNLRYVNVSKNEKLRYLTVDKRPYSSMLPRYIEKVAWYDARYKCWTYGEGC